MNYGIFSRSILPWVAASVAACAGAPATEPKPAAPAASAPAAPEPERAAAEPWREKRPAAGPQPEISLPTFTRDKLKNGLSILVTEAHQLPMVSFVLVTRGGSAADPAGSAGLTNLTYQALSEAGGGRNALQFSDAVADLGAAFGAGADQDGGSVRISGLSRHSDAMLGLVADAALRPRFDRADFERVKAQQLANLEHSRGSPQGLAFEFIPAMIYGDKHPYGHPVTGVRESVQKLSLDQVKRHALRLLSPGASALIAVGDIDPAEAKRLAEKHFGAWKGAPGADKSEPAVPPRAREQVVIIHKDNAPQTMVVVGRPIFGFGDPNHAALTVTNQIYGGSFSSRLNMNLREAKGYTYGAHSSASPRRGVGALFAYSMVRQDVTAESLREVIDELQKMTGSPPSQDEIGRAKESLIRSLPGDFETTGAIAAAASGIFVYNLPLDYYAHWPERLQAVTPESVAQIGAEYFKPGVMQILLVGDSAQIGKSVEALNLGKVLVRQL